jgi:hypothetical protein
MQMNYARGIFSKPQGKKGFADPDLKIRRSSTAIQVLLQQQHTVRQQEEQGPGNEFHHNLPQILRCPRTGSIQLHADSTTTHLSTI